MSRPLSRLLLAAALAAPLCAPAPARAYEPRNTHRWITRQAAKLLMEAYPGRYDELQEYIDAVAEGSQHEDDYLLDGDSDITTLRVMRHFFRPTDFAGLTMPDIPTPFPNSYEWGVLPNEQNAWGWDDGLAAYRAGDKHEAYFVLGHMVHLIEDLTVPAHSHLDIHGPPAGDDYETWCAEQTTNEFTAELPLPPPGTQVPEFASAWEAWHATGRASYWRNMYPGDLSDTDAAAGVIAQMFPDLSWSWFFEEWSIGAPPVGKLGSAFWEAEPGWFYFKKTEYPATSDRMSFDRDDPAAADAVAYGDNAQGDPMAALIARDMIPLAVVNSAGVMKLYLDQVYAQGVDPPPADPMPEPEPAPEAGGCQLGGGHAAVPAGLLCAALALLIARRRK